MVVVSTPLCAGAKLPSALSQISQTAWEYVKHDFGLKMRGVPSTALGVDGPDVAPYEWKPDTREDDQKQEYMGYMRDIFPLDEDAGVWFGGTPRLCVMCVDVLNHRRLATY